MNDRPRAGNNRVQAENDRNSNKPSSAVPRGSEDLFEKFRSKLAARGARGIIGIQRQFKIMDDDNSHTTMS